MAITNKLFEVGSLWITFILLSGLCGYSQSQDSIINLKILNRSDLYIDTLNFSSDPGYLKISSPRGSLFNLAYFRNEEAIILIPKVSNLKDYGDTILFRKIGKDTLKIFCHFEDSKPKGLWKVTDKKEINRSEYMFINGKCVFANFYDENRILIREIFYSDTIHNQLDRWYLDSKLIRYTFPVENGILTYIYYPNGNLMWEYLYDKNGEFEKGLQYDIDGKILAHVNNKSKPSSKK